jgi:hypothetical protein
MKTVFLTFILSTGVLSGDNPKSDNDPEKRIQKIGEHMSDWVQQNLCRDDDHCLKATDNWVARIAKVTDALVVRFGKCGSIPERKSRRRRDEDSEGADLDDEYDYYEDDELVENSKTTRYNKADPVKGILQLTGAAKKWVDQYLSLCGSQFKRNHGVHHSSIRFMKWKILLNNAYAKGPFYFKFSQFFCSLFIGSC